MMNIVDLYVRFAVSPVDIDFADPPASAVVAIVVFASFIISQPPFELCCKETDAMLR